RGREVPAVSCVAALWLAAALRAAGPGPRGLPHPGPPVYVEVEIEPEGVRVRFTGEQTTWLAWFGKDPVATPPWAAPLTASAEAEIEGHARALPAAGARITVEGAVGEPVLEAIDVPPDEVTGYGVPALTFTLRYPLAR